MLRLRKRKSVIKKVQLYSKKGIENHVSRFKKAFLTLRILPADVFDLTHKTNIKSVWG